MRPKSRAVVRLTAMLLGGGGATLSMAAAVPAFAQMGDGSLSGTVSQADNGAMLGGATVRIDETGQTATTDSQGSYRFGNLPAGTYTVVVDYLGFRPQRESVAVVGEGVRHDVMLGESGGAIVVTGQRAAQAKALSEQRSADNTRNVVSADQAGRFPDFNAAEALRRVPGVSVQREVDAGEGRYISIRGLDSGLNNTQLNGMNAAQPEKENRRVPLDMIQTSALSQIPPHPAP